MRPQGSGDGGFYVTLSLGMGQELGASKRGRAIHREIGADVCPAMPVSLSDNKLSLVIVIFLGQAPSLLDIFVYI